MRYEHVLQAVFGSPWAIKPEMYALICEIVRDRAMGDRLTAEEITQRIGAARVRSGAARNGSIAVLPLHGVLAPRMNMAHAISGGTSLEVFGAMFRQAMADPQIAAVVLDVDSPGGSVFGVPELWDDIFQARGVKPVVAVSNPMAASAAYWLATAAEEIVASPSAELGSVGVIAAHEDISSSQAKQGITTTLVMAGRRKALGNQYEPLTDEARADIQGKVDAYYAMFVDAVARGRGVRPADVRSGYGEGGTVLAQEALKLGMVDTVATLQQTIDRLSGTSSARRRGAVAMEAELSARRRRLLLS